MNKLSNIALAGCTHPQAHAHTMLNVLIACEESQAECSAFRELGHNAFSCDLQKCRPSGNPSWHIVGDCVPYLPPPTFFACPSWFGVKYTKKTLYWTKNLPPLVADMEYPNPKEFVRSSRGKYRSRTFPELARAIARQWSSYIINDLQK